MRRPLTMRGWIRQVTAMAASKAVQPTGPAAMAAVTGSDPTLLDVAVDEAVDPEGSVGVGDGSLGGLVADAVRSLDAGGESRVRTRAARSPKLPTAERARSRA
ncbi:hypothetical protein ABT063_24545 [Streptomyces sp. NPDC002838]|uniref:hypothetical protein n=1 Tax=Streptomyces sp. NPDC002838 TaxID=3154436 RepID=UPI00331A0002